MRCLIIVAHPLPTSLSHRFATVARDGLVQSGHDVEWRDLYAEDFDPRLSATERGAYYQSPHEHSQIGSHAQSLIRADMLVLAFPTWWFSPPAILKGWIDRVFAPGIAFDHGADFGPIRPRLTTLKRVVAITTLGSPWWVDRFVMHRPVRRLLKTAVLGGCAPQARFSYVPFHSAENPGSARLDRFERKVRAAIALPS